VMASRLQFEDVLGPRCRERDLAYALIVSQVIAAASKVSAIRCWDDTSLGADLGIAGVHTDEVDAAMDWLVARQDVIEKKLAGRHLVPGGMALFDLSSTRMEAESVEFGVLGDTEGRPVAVRVSRRSPVVPNRSLTPSPRCARRSDCGT
jgi:hypothetical protein